MPQANDRVQDIDIEGLMARIKDRSDVFFELAPDGYFVHDLKGVFLGGNAAAEQICGYPRDDLIGRSFLRLNLLPRRQIPKALSILARLAAGRPTGPDEFVLRRKDGSEAVVEIRSYPIKAAEQTIILAIARNVTQRRRTEQLLHDSEARFREIFENSSDLIQCVRPDGSIAYVNPAWKRALQYDDAELEEIKLFDIIHAADQEHCARLFPRVLDGEDVGTIEVTFVAKDGTDIPVEGNTSCQFKDGIAVATRGVFRNVAERRRADEAVRRSHMDLEERVRERTAQLEATNARLIDEINDKRRAEEALENSAERLRTSLDTTNTCCWDINLLTDELIATKPSVTWLGYTPDEISESREWWKGLIHPDDVEIPKKAFEDYLCGRTDRYECEYRVRSKSGAWCWTLDRGMAVERTADGEPARLVGTNTDITDRKRTEQALHDSERRLRLLTDAMPAFISYLGADRRYRFVNRHYESCFGIAQDEAIGRHVSDMLGEANYHEILPHVESALAGNRVSYESTLRFKGEESRTLQVEFVPDLDSGGEVRGYYTLAVDITDRKRAEEALHRSEVQYRSLLDDHVDAVAIIVDGELVYVNRRCCEIGRCERDELIGHSVLDFLAEPDPSHGQQRVSGMLSGGASQPQVYTAVRKDGTQVPIEAASRVTQYQGRRALMTVFRDVSAKQELEEQLLRHQQQLEHIARMNSLGELSASLAHELNQPLAAIANFAAASLVNLQSPNTGPPNPEVVSSLEEIKSQSLRAGNIIHGLRKLFRSQTQAQQPFSINGCIRDVVALVRPDVTSRDVTIRLEIEKRLPDVLGESIQIEQVLINLLRNSVEAIQIADCSQREITIQSALLPDREDIEVVVRDTGPGIPDEQQDNIFNSFITTKPEGLGMGLTISRRIVEAHAGQIGLLADNTGGTAIRFTLPVYR